MAIVESDFPFECAFDVSGNSVGFVVVAIVVIVLSTLEGVGCFAACVGVVVSFLLVIGWKDAKIECAVKEQKQ